MRCWPSIAARLRTSYRTGAVSASAPKRSQTPHILECHRDAHTGQGLNTGGLTKTGHASEQRVLGTHVRVVVDMLVNLAFERLDKGLRLSQGILRQLKLRDQHTPV